MVGVVVVGTALPILDGRRPSPGFVVVSLVFLAAAVLLVDLSSRSRWKRIPALRESFEVAWDDHEISVENAVRRTTYKPGGITRVERGPGAMTMWSFDAPVITIPDRCFADDAPRDDLLAVARRQLEGRRGGT